MPLRQPHRLLCIWSATVLCLSLLGCGPSAQDENAYRDFYAAVDEVWNLMSTRDEAGTQAKLDAAITRVENEAKRYKAIQPQARKALHERNKAIHDGSSAKYQQMLNGGGSGFDFLGANKRMSDILVDAFGAKVNSPSSPLQTSVLYAYDQAYKK